MYFPPNFDRNRAIELGNLVNQAHDQYECFKNKKPWQLRDGYIMVCEIKYWSLFGQGEEVEPTIIDHELHETNKDLLGKHIPMGFVARRDTNAYLVFRGTETVGEWISDFKAPLVPYFLPNWGKVHKGFHDVYNKCEKSFIDAIGGLDKSLNLFITGHSLGAALSVLALPEAVSKTSFKQPTLYNFGCPRVGDDTFVQGYNGLVLSKSFRVVNTSDPVTSVPPPAPLPVLGGAYYSHVDTPVDFTKQNGSIKGNHIMDTYLTALNQG